MLTLCFLYCVFSLISISGFLFFTLEIHELIFWCYQLIPAGIALVPIFKQVIKFFLSWMHFMFHLCEVCVYLAIHIFSFLVTLISICMPYLSKPIYIMCSFFKWMYSEIWRGIYLRGNPFLTLLSWIMIMCTFLLCVVNIFLQRTVPRNVQNRQRNGHNRNEEDQNDQENENVENRLIEVQQQRLLNRQHHLPVIRTNQNEPTHDEDNPENINLDDNLQLCIICIENVRNFAVFPCGHLHFCRLCVENLFRSRTNVKCPVCNIHIEDYRRIYV